MTEFWKDKRVIAYIALTHHTRFITPVMDRLAQAGARVCYVVGQAENSQLITAIKGNLDHVHVYDYLDQGDLTEIRQNYLQMRDAFARSLTRHHALATQLVTVTDKTIQATAAEYIGFRNLLAREKPDLCIALHELNRWGKMFAFWAKTMNIPVITFQEGLYYGMDYAYTGHVQYSTLNLVWGETSRNKLKDFEAPESRIIPVGNTHLADELQRQKAKGIREATRKSYNVSDAVAVLLVLPPGPPSVPSLMPLMTAAASGGIRLFIKFHPVMQRLAIDQWTARIPEDCRQKIVFIHGQETVYDLIALCDLCVLTQPTTTGLEALYMGKPLIQLDLPAAHVLPYSFTEKKVAVSMTPEALARALAENQDMAAMVDPKAVRTYLDNELSGTGDAIERVMGIAEALVRASRRTSPPPLEQNGIPGMEWSIILPVSIDPGICLRQLEAIALASENQGSYEVILLQEDPLPEPVTKILETLRGDVVLILKEPGENLPAMMTRAGRISGGKNLIFLHKNLAPAADWLYTLKKGRDSFGEDALLGARVLDGRGTIIHAGIVVDENHTPVSAYKSLDRDFSPALKERPFQLLDHVLCIHRDLFFRLGGFEPETGGYAFLDMCLRAEMLTRQNNRARYLPDLVLTRLGAENRELNPDHAIAFFGRWHASLWPSRDSLHSQDGVSESDLCTEQFTSAVKPFFTGR